jgi:hypothetical protein
LGQALIPPVAAMNKNSSSMITGCGLKLKRMAAKYNHVQ